MWLGIGVTNHSAAQFFSTNQHRVFSPCDHDDVSMPIFGHKSHVTPHMRWSHILGIVLRTAVSPSPLAFPRKSNKKHTGYREPNSLSWFLMDVPRKTLRYIRDVCDALMTSRP